MKHAYSPDEPIAAIATALANAALGVIRVSGTNSVNLLSAVFSRAKALQKAGGHTLTYGWIVAPGGKKIDEVLVAVYRSPKSLTGEEAAEIFCHGGTSTVLAIQELLLQSGFRQAERGEFTFRAFVNGKTDLTKAEAVREIIEAKTDESRSHAAERLHGNLQGEIKRIERLIIDAISAIEVEVEYPEDEETISSVFDSRLIETVCAELSRLSSTWSAEKLYQEGARVVLCGRPNAGKSSLFNVLLKEDRAIVSRIPGTTRDWIESWASFAGIPVRLFDTAGLRETQDTIEKTGVERTLDICRQADLLIHVIDSGCGIHEDDRIFLESIQTELPRGTPVLRVWNKCDVQENTAGDSTETAEKNGISGNAGNTGCKTGDTGSVSDVHSVRISAKTGFGITDLVGRAQSLLLEHTDPGPGTAALGSERQKKAVDEALECVKHGLEALKSGFTLDALVQDLEDALAAIGEITGETTPDDILENVFSSFCVGK